MAWRATTVVIAPVTIERTRPSLSDSVIGR
jgi:hypothetical protein